MSMSIEERSLRAYGRDAQVLKMGEECSELAQAVQKYYALWHYGQYKETLSKEILDMMAEARDNIIMELADVKIMFDQMMLLHGPAIEKAVKIKTKRAEERLNALR